MRVFTSSDLDTVRRAAHAQLLTEGFQRAPHSLGHGQANDRSIVDMHQKTTANADRPDPEALRQVRSARTCDGTKPTDVGSTSVGTGWGPYSWISREGKACSEAS